MSLHERTRLYLQYGTLAVRDYCIEKGYLATFERLGVEMIMPGCGACANCGPGSSTRADQVTVSAINRSIAIAGGIAAVNTVGQLSGMVAPLLVGYINDVGGNTYLGMLALAPFCLICTGVVYWGLPDDRTTGKPARRFMNVARLGR
ncbi:aconitase family protein [Pseudomonas asgharzadehiana]|uniref:Major facilitator superfamily (MFS) profile domain-containing protein n=1 Tax=Pseudomonas asgharzadehiana TaxID=2842349 RepID=A0ABX8NXU0_9PSED|nr:aconitase family protein [Pseudomonas asgharzadehiana]QXH66279.1 hypothetical protein KSS96_22100 [Pseudomonas asgharzadehiana]